MSEEYKIDPTVAYDVVQLPSGGIYYPTKKKSLRIGYLTASDENILSSPSLIRSGEVMNELLKRKVLDKDFNLDELVEEDRQAILIFLRNTAWGTEYSLNITDPKTGDKLPVKVDLSTLKIKDFTLVEDANGEYPYFFEKSKINITFRFLLKKDEDELEKMEESWDNKLGVAPIKTKELEKMIKTINGVKDQMSIHNFIEKLPIKDSQDFKKFILENKPGLDLTQTVTTPSGEDVKFVIGFGVEFFRPFYGL